MKYRVIWDYSMKKVVEVVQDQETTITTFPDLNKEYAVVDGLNKIKLILESEGYDVTLIEQTLNNNL